MQFIAAIFVALFASSAIAVPVKKEREKRTVPFILGSIIKGLILKEAALNLLVQAANASQAASNMTQSNNGMMQQPQGGGGGPMSPPQGGNGGMMQPPQGGGGGPMSPPQGGNDGMMQPPQGGGMMQPPQNNGAGMNNQQPPPGGNNVAQSPQGNGGAQDQSNGQGLPGPSRVPIPLPPGSSSDIGQISIQNQQGGQAQPSGPAEQAPPLDSNAGGQSSESSEEEQPSGPPEGPQPSGPSGSGSSSDEVDENDDDNATNNGIQERIDSFNRSPSLQFNNNFPSTNLFQNSGRRSTSNIPGNFFSPFTNGAPSFFHHHEPTAQSYMRSQDGYEFTNFHRRRNAYSGDRPQSSVRYHGAPNHDQYDHSFVPHFDYQQRVFHY